MQAYRIAENFRVSVENENFAVKQNYYVGVALAHAQLTRIHAPRARIAELPRSIADMHSATQLPAHKIWLRKLSRMVPKVFPLQRFPLYGTSPVVGSHVGTFFWVEAHVPPVLRW